MKKLVSTPGLEMVCLWGCGCLAFVLPECRAQGAKACLGLGTTLLGSTYLVLSCLYGPDRLSPAVSTMKVFLLGAAPLCTESPPSCLLGHSLGLWFSALCFSSILCPA